MVPSPAMGTAAGLWVGTGPAGIAAADVLARAGLGSGGIDRRGGGVGACGPCAGGASSACLRGRGADAARTAHSLSRRNV